jgi:hypothetical protein
VGFPDPVYLSIIKVTRRATELSFSDVSRTPEFHVLSPIGIGQNHPRDKKTTATTTKKTTYLLLPLMTQFGI